MHSEAASEESSGKDGAPRSTAGNASTSRPAGARQGLSVDITESAAKGTAVGQGATPAASRGKSRQWRKGHLVSSSCRLPVPPFRCAQQGGRGQQSCAVIGRSPSHALGRGSSSPPGWAYPSLGVAVKGPSHEHGTVYVASAASGPLRTGCWGPPVRPSASSEDAHLTFLEGGNGSPEGSTTQSPCRLQGGKASGRPWRRVPGIRRRAGHFWAQSLCQALVRFPQHQLLPARKGAVLPSHFTGGTRHR